MTGRSLSLRLGLTAGLLAAGLCAPTSAASPAVEVRPGGVVRWPGEGIVVCAAKGRAWAPLAGACWYPVDLLASPGASLILERTRAGREEQAELRVAPYPYPIQKLEVEPRMVDLAPADLARHETERARVEALWTSGGPARFTLPLAHPLAGGGTGRSFGNRRIFNNEPRSPHTGVDFPVPRGTAVRAACDGQVALAEDHYFSGRSVFVDHGGGLITMYFHLDRVDVRTGDEVRRGQTIGTVGATGRATGPHLHFGVRWLGARVDPQVLLEPSRATRIGD